MPEPPVPKVMLVGDDPQFAYLIQRYAAAGGCQYIHTSSGGQALVLALDERPDLILLDISPGGPSGWHVLRALKADPTLRRIAVFVCSANEAAMHECEEQADGCLLKPIMYEDFLAALDKSKSHLAADAAR